MNRKLVNLCSFTELHDSGAWRHGNRRSSIFHHHHFYGENILGIFFFLLHKCSLLIVSYARNHCIYLSFAHKNMDIDTLVQ